MTRCILLAGRVFSSFLCSGVETGCFTGLSTAIWPNLDACMQSQACMFPRTEDSSATEVIPALIASRWVSWSPPSFDSRWFGKSCYQGPCSSVFDVNSQSTYINTFPQILPVRRLQPLPAVLSERMLGEKQWQHPFERETRKDSLEPQGKRERWILAKIWWSHIFRGFKIKTILSSKGIILEYLCRLMVKRQTTSFHLVGTKHAAPFCKQTDFLKREIAVDHPSLDSSVPLPTCAVHSPTSSSCYPWQPTYPSALQFFSYPPWAYLLLHFCKMPFGSPCFPPVLSLNNNQKKKERIICLLVLLGKHLHIKNKEWTFE